MREMFSSVCYTPRFQPAQVEIREHKTNKLQRLFIQSLRKTSARKAHQQESQINGSSIKIITSFSQFLVTLLK